MWRLRRAGAGRAAQRGRGPRRRGRGARRWRRAPRRRRGLERLVHQVSGPVRELVAWSRDEGRRLQWCRIAPQSIPNPPSCSIACMAASLNQLTYAERLRSRGSQEVALGRHLGCSRFRVRARACASACDSVDWRGGVHSEAAAEVVDDASERPLWRGGTVWWDGGESGACEVMRFGRRAWGGGTAMLREEDKGRRSGLDRPTRPTSGWPRGLMKRACLDRIVTSRLFSIVLSLPAA